MPYQTNGQRAESDNPSTWTSFRKAAEAWGKTPQKFAGLGFVFQAGDPFAGIDLDNCLDEEQALKPWAEPIMERFADTYVEISPSGRGVKIWARARLDGKGKAEKHGDSRIEIYDRGRFFTLTGRGFDGAPLNIAEHQADVSWLVALVSGVNGTGPKREQKKADLKNQWSVPEGDRYFFLQSVAAQFGARGMRATEIYAALCAVNLERCTPPKTDTVLRLTSVLGRKTAARAIGTFRGRPRRCGAESSAVNQSSFFSVDRFWEC